MIWGFLEWDDDCEGLIRTVACEEEWRRCDESNTMVQWGVFDVTEGWEVPPPASLAWEVVIAKAGTWPSKELVEAQVAAWLGFLPDHIEIEVTVEKCSSVGGFAGEHSACRSL
jgi:hypothetical protein